MSRAFRAAVTVPLLVLLAACGPDTSSSGKPQAGAASSAAAPGSAMPSAPASGAVPGGAPAAGASAGAQGAPADPAAHARQVVATLSDADLAGQVLMPYAYGGSATDVDEAAAAGNQTIAGVRTPAEMIAKFHLGGLILVAFTPEDPTGKTNPATNVDNPQQVRTLTDGLQAAARALPGGVPLLIGTDQEYGVVTRVKSGVTLLPSAMTFGAGGKPTLTRGAWRAAGEELAAMGINLDFAPVADTLGPQGNTVIGSRSYGADAKANAAQVGAAVRGIEQAGVAAAVKHFPGHGHTTGDSHEGLPVVRQQLAQWQQQDRPPFAAGIAAGASVVMSGHLDVEALDKGVAATFSHKIMTDVLRTSLGFKGVAITDAMNMAPAMKWPAGEAAVRALNAGNDMLLMPPDLAGARDGILAGLASGSLKRERLVEAVTRILTLKFRLAAKPQPALTTVGSPAHQRAVSAADAAAVTVLRGRCQGPLVTGPITITTSEGRETARADLTAALQAAGLTVQPTGGTIVHLVGYGDKQPDLSPAAAVTVMMDVPTLLAQAKSPTLLATYSSSPLALKALAAVLAGKAKAPGKSPVAVGKLPRTACAK